MDSGKAIVAWLSFVLAAAPAVAQTPPATAATPGLAVVRGRCVAAETGAPLAGCTVKFEGWASNDTVMNRHGRPDWKDPEPVVTKDDGRFEFRFVPPPPFQHHLDASGPGRVPRTARWGAFQPGQIDDLGDVPMSLGYEVTGRVLDQDGKPVPSLGVLLVDLPLPLRKDAANDSRSGFTDEDGRFRVGCPIPAGTWSLRVQGAGCSLVDPEAAKVLAQAEPNVLQVRVQRMPSIGGVIFDEKGRPVAGVSLNAVPGAGQWMTSGRSRKDGSFTIYKRDGSPDEVRLDVLDPGPCEAKAIDGTFAWGTNGLRLEFRRALSFELTVVEAATGMPVEQYSVQCYPMARAGHSLATSLRLGLDKHVDGKVVVDRVWRGQNVLCVVPRDPALAPSVAEAFVVDEAGVGPRRVELVRLQPIDLRLVRADGKPITACEAWIVDDVGGPGHELTSGTFHDPRLAGFGMLSTKVPLPLVLASGTTDAEGRVRLSHGPTRGKLALVVRLENGFKVVAGFDPAAVQDGKVVVR